MTGRGMVIKGLWLVSALLIICPNPATPADEASIALLDEAKAQISSAQLREAMSGLQAALLKIWSAPPMFVSKAVIVKKKALGFGMYQPRGTNVFKTKEPILIYLEPVGYTIRQGRNLLRSVWKLILP